MKQHPIATIQMASGGRIKLEIYPECAPNTATSFIWLANQGAYDQREIKRIVPDFVIQPSFTSFDRDPICDYMISGEYRANGVENNLKLSKYTVAMGGDGEALASGSCFFIAVADCEEKLDGKYAAFAKVIEGFEEIERLLHVELEEKETDLPNVVVNEPKVPEIMTSIRVETFGEVYGEPIKTNGVWAYEKNAIRLNQIYRHFKGNDYLVLHLAKHSETGEDLIVYQALYGEKGIWVRPLSMFVETVKHEGKWVKRFKPISE